MRREDWNARYAEGGLLWGVEPNRFVAAEATELEPGRALDLACGEGRNAVWLAERGWDVLGIDYSDVAIDRATRMAAARGVDVGFVVADVLRAPIEPHGFDLVLVAYLQLPHEERLRIVERAAEAVAPNGTFLLVGHHLRNLEEGTGGPSDPSRLWTLGEIVERLEAAGITVQRADEVLRDVEGAERPAIDALVRGRREQAAA